MPNPFAIFFGSIVAFVVLFVGFDVLATGGVATVFVAGEVSDVIGHLRYDLNGGH